MPNKALGQHWLKDRLVLEAIADSIAISPSDIILEIGPGLGTLTSVLLARASKVIAVEYDGALARKLPAQFPRRNLEVRQADFLTFPLESLPAGYKVIANVPYYITQKIIERFLLTDNQPAEMALLVQKEVAQKLAATAGAMTAIAAKAQFLYDVELGEIVGREFFTPPPKVDSQVVIFKKLHVDKHEYPDKKSIFRVIQSGFSAPRKKLRTSLAGGLQLTKEQVAILCKQAKVDDNLRAQDLSVPDWIELAKWHATITVQEEKHRDIS